MRSRSSSGGRRHHVRGLTLDPGPYFRLASPKEPGMSSLSIGQIDEQAGVAIDTARYYERNALLVPAGRLASGYRCYGSANWSDCASFAVPGLGLLAGRRARTADPQRRARYCQGQAHGRMPTRRCRAANRRTRMHPHRPSHTHRGPPGAWTGQGLPILNALTHEES